MLKELITAAIILPFVRAQKMPDTGAIDRVNAIDVTEEPTPILARSELEAVREFTEEMIEYAAGDSVKMQWLKLSYDQMAPTRGWPSMSPKALSSRLVYWGCTRIQLDLRPVGEGRPTAMVFPFSITGGKAKKFKEAPKQRKTAGRVKYKKGLTFDALFGAVNYNSKTGEFTCRSTGAIIGRLGRKGYVDVYLNGQTYQAHRLAWFYSYRRWPKGNIDHADGNPSNNALSNLRECDQSQNAANSKTPAHNSTGVKGVTFDKAAGKYRARIRVNGELFSLGLYSELDAAAKAYEKAASRYFGEFARPDRRRK